MSNHQLIQQIVAPSQVVEEAEATPLSRSQQWMDESRDMRHAIMSDILPTFIERIREYGELELEDVKEKRLQAEFGRRLIETVAMPAPSVNFSQVQTLTERRETKYYTPPIVITREEMVEATRIALDGRAEEAKIKERHLKASQEGKLES